MDTPQAQRYLRQSEIPTVPAPRQEHAETRTRLLAAYRKESARLVRFKAELKAMGIDPEAAWGEGPESGA